MGTDVIVVIVVATALAFDFTNGFHDTANVVATSISTRAMAPRIAVAYAAILNFVGAFISLEVAATVAKDVVDPAAISLLAIFAGLVGAIAWNLITWYFGLPSSSSHALIGGIVGAVLVSDGPGRDLLRHRDPRQGDDPRARRADPGVRGRRASAILLIYRIVGSMRPARATRGFRVRPGDLGRPAGARPRHERRPEDHGRDHPRPGGQRQRSRPTTSTCRTGSWSPRPRRSRWAPTSAAGGSSRPWAAASTRWTPPRASPPRAPAPR